MDSKEKARNRHLLKTYGITLEAYNCMLKNQEFKCAMCGKHQDDCKRSLHVDHDHRKLRKGELFKPVRGLLCFYCNRELCRKHNLKTALQLVRYLLRYSEPGEFEDEAALFKEQKTATCKES